MRAMLVAAVFLTLASLACSEDVQAERDLLKRRLYEKEVTQRMQRSLFVRLGRGGPCFFHAGEYYSASVTWLPCSRVPTGYPMLVLKGPRSHENDPMPGTNGQ